MKVLVTSVVVCLGLASPSYGQSFMDILQDLTGLQSDEKAAESEAPSELIEEAPPAAEDKTVEAEDVDTSFLPDKNIPTNGVVLRGLDKDTARVYAIEARVGETVSFGLLKIKVHHCEMAPPEERPESTAFLTITQMKPDGDETPLFKGWMFASSPSLSALDHPTFDVWVKSCKELL